MMSRKFRPVPFQLRLAALAALLIPLSGCGGAHEHTHPLSAIGNANASAHRANAQGNVVPHTQLAVFENNGNQLVGIATKSMGAQSFEVWRTSIAPGSATPAHRHATEEVFIFLSGSGRAKIGEKTFEFSAPATVIAPAGLEHQFFNTGAIATDAIVVVGIDSAIYDHAGKEMSLPWRK
jgi:mannose-6-phosphate isomerase-like protein (cupin superfamily)